MITALVTKFFLGAMIQLSSPVTSIGNEAPEFTLMDVQGKSHSLKDYRGKTVVLEWVNYDCPFVKKHYGSGNMQALQTRWTKDGVVWISINSSAEGKQGSYRGEELLARMKKEKAAPSAYLLDGNGKVGLAYGAKTTPHLYIINKEGVLVYAGGIDDQPSTDPEDIKGATNYVEAALTEIAARKVVATPTSRPYGCSVKY
jgi:peroxiredoxin